MPQYEKSKYEKASPCTRSTIPFGVRTYAYDIWKVFVYQVRKLSLCSAGLLVPVTWFSAGKIVSHSLEQQAAPACVVVPVSNIMLVFPAGTYQRYRWTTTGFFFFAGAHASI